MFEAAIETEMSDLFSEMLKVNFTVGRDDMTALRVKNKVELLKFLENHCIPSVKKCIEVQCNTSSPPRLPLDVFASLHHLPDPIPR